MFFYIQERENIMKIEKFDAIKEKINKFDSMAKTDMTKINSVFPQKENLSVSERMKKFFDVADGKNPSWNV